MWHRQRCYPSPRNTPPLSCIHYAHTKLLVCLVARATSSTPAFFGPHIFPFTLFVLSLGRFATADPITWRWLWVFPLLPEELHSEEFIGIYFFPPGFGPQQGPRITSPLPRRPPLSFYPGSRRFWYSSQATLMVFSLYTGRPQVVFALLKTARCVHRTPAMDLEPFPPFPLFFFFSFSLCA